MSIPILRKKLGKEKENKKIESMKIVHLLHTKWAKCVDIIANCDFIGAQVSKFRTIHACSTKNKYVLIFSLSLKT